MTDNLIYLFANNAVTTLAEVITSEATTIALKAGTGELFPQPVPGGEAFAATIFNQRIGSNEIVLVIARTGDTVTVIRAQEDTIAQPWAADSLFQALSTRDVMAGMVQKAEQPVIDNVAALKDFLGRPPLVQLAGYYEAGDGGEGIYRWAPGSDADPNDGLVIEPNVGSEGRWIRSYTGAISALWFGVRADGVTDDTLNLQKMADAIMVLGSVDLQLPRGTMRVTSTINFFNQGTASIAMPTISGTGPATTIFDGRLTATGPVLSLRGTPQNGSIPPAGIFGFAGGMRDFGVVGSNASGLAQVTGVKIVGWWGAKHEGLRITGCSLHGIDGRADLDWYPDPDYSASSGHEWFNCIVERIGGYGFYNPDVQGCPGMLFPQTLFVLCYEGGALINSDGCEFVGSSFAGCGWESESTPIDPDHKAYGLEMARGNRIVAQGCEFDSNKTAHIAIGTASWNTIGNNRFIFNNRYTGDVMRPRYGVEFGYGSNSQIAAGNTLTENFQRIDVPAHAITPEGNSIVLYQYSNPSAGNVWGNRIFQRYLFNSNDTLVTAAVGWDLNSRGMYFDNVVDVQLEAGDVATPGFTKQTGLPLPFITVTIPFGTAVPTVLGALPFDTIGSTLNSPDYPWKSAYSTSTYRFTFAIRGFVQINVAASINPGLLSTDFGRLRLTKNGGTSPVALFDWYFTGSTASGERCTAQGSIIVEADVGDTLEIEGHVSRGGLTFYGASVSYQMLNSF